MRIDINDIKYMRRAIALSRKGTGTVNPNPLVGAVIEKNNTIIAEGYHEYYGGPHAEVNAFQNTPADTQNSTLYVTLEPCAHFGKTPPCSDEIIKRGIKRVVIGMIDPNPLVSGKGIKKLIENGIEVITGIEENKIRILNESYIKFITSGIPFVTLKTAVSIDGKIELPGTPGFRISNSRSHQYVQRLRKINPAIMVGVSTVLSDDPLLTVRALDQGHNQPFRIILDSKGRTPLNAKVLLRYVNSKAIVYTTKFASAGFIENIIKTGNEVVVSDENDGKLDLNFVLRDLGNRGISSILVEGGSELNFSMIKENIPDKMILFVNPRIIGGSSTKTMVGGSPFQTAELMPGLTISRIKRSDEDIIIEAYFNKTK